MTSVRQLYVLQELDLVLDKLNDKHAEAAEELNHKATVEALEEELRVESERLQELELQQQTNRRESEDHRQRSQTLETQLYDGSLTNPRDLESLEQEASNVRKLLETEEAALLELSAQAEGSKAKCAELDRALAETRTKWENRQAELSKLIKDIVDERGDYESQRSKLVEGVDPAALQRYETLRKSKRGLAVARVERGLCQGCQMALPTHLAQRVRSGRQTVNCNSCGRLLFLG